MATTVERDLRRAKELRNMKKGVHDPNALRGIDDAADRLERNAAKKLKRIGRPVRKRVTASSSGRTTVG